MITYRLRGLVTAYALFTIVSASLLLLGLAELVPHLPYVDLSETVNLTPYMLAVMAGMLMGARDLSLEAQRLHRLQRLDAAMLALRQVFVVAACIFTLMFAIKDRAISRVFLGVYLTVLFGYLAWSHARIPRGLARMLFPQQRLMRTLFVGRFQALERLNDWVANREHLGIRPIGLLCDEVPTRADHLIAPPLGKIADAKRIIGGHGVQQVIMLELMEDVSAVEHLVDACQAEGTRLLIYNNYADRLAQSFVPLEEGGHQFLALQEEPLEDPINRVFKRILDICISLPVVLVVLPPLTLFVWLVQRWQAPGPVFFARPRGGQYRKSFNMFKFRSMFTAERDDQKEAQQASSGDDRIYPLGRWLRRTSLDEFPQFINVLRGEMSVVGPRPHLPRHDDEFAEQERAYRQRMLVKPGITGMAQTKGFRGEIDDPAKLSRRVYWDLHYVNHWTPSLDIVIILRTFWQVFFPPNSAY
ncbi:exopolysaccharide biosynthesis polyprenyl glycosylphosphotransferase [Synoicihabitans lomoniglobus]|uniref:Exopolysaccharide biosynthesis polyprenyl glycosylphosphotransferase n=1 Tax=Synoicihabitans lomoniglobus TaxID=2909285 RepID=A0AAF0CQS9_9BACT|nr:exopolysaccharide biosynthesis polyprenyl glycosylphosphotransferase [Opitutaceae bacterium LMO-M01]WED66369.1 exopolysaccharide biosynthesis polyprenyl glycosylphosphotransferase [Opitutaceae bacterium LMO-M01]